MPAAEDERTGAVEAVEQAQAVRREGAASQSGTKNRSTRSCAQTIAVRRPIGNASVSGSAGIRPRNSRPPTTPATRSSELPERARVEQRDRRCRDRDRRLDRPARQRSRHRDHGRQDDRGGGELEAVHPAGTGEVDVACPERERREDDGGGQREPEPRREATELAGAVDADRDPDLARRGAGQDARERDELSELLLADPLPARDVLVVEVADVGDRAAERRQPEPECGAKDLAGGALLA